MNIEFFPSSQEVYDLVPPPQPAKLITPEWYKNIPNLDGKKKLTFDPNGAPNNKNIKMCMPFLDAMSVGYIQTTWCEIYVEKEDDGGVRYYYASNPQIMSHREKPAIEKNDSYYDLEFVWRSPWVPKVPKGYSVLLTHPNNRVDLPFTTLSGVIDADSYYHTPFGNFPFYIHKDFEGLIPIGTPMYQMIPVKRENWKSSINEFDATETSQRYATVLNRFSSTYKKLFWSRKNYL